MRTPIKYYDKLFEIYGTDRAAGKHAESAKEKVKRWEKNKETIDLNDDDGFQIFEVEWNDGQHTPHSTNYSMGYSPEIGASNQSNGFHGISSRGAKRKSPLNDLIETDLEKDEYGYPRVDRCYEGWELLL